MTLLSPVDVQGRVDEILNRRPAVGAAFGVVRNGSMEFFCGHGYADIESHTPVTEDTGFRVGSITKTFTAIAALQLWERGAVDLDAPAGDYLRAYQLVPAQPGWRPATLRHLLTHTSGIAQVVPPSAAFRPGQGVAVKEGRRVPTLAEYYRGRVPLVAEPGTRFRYTDHGMAAAGQIVEDVSGLPLDRYLREHVFRPLGMTRTDLLRSELVRPGLATGYRLRSGGPEAVPEIEDVTAAAGATLSTPGDMGRYVAALLGGGANEHGSVLEPDTMAAMFEPQYQPDPRLPGMGLAFFRGDAGGHPVVEHQGVLPPWMAQIFLAPDDGVGVMAFSNGTARGPAWLPIECGNLLSELLGVAPEGIRAGVRQHPEVWGDICGWYRFTGPLSEVLIRAMMGAGVEVFVRRGRLWLRFLNPAPPLYSGFELHPDDENDPYAFRMPVSVFGMPTIPVRVVFSRDPATGTTAIHMDLQLISAVRQPARTNPRRWVTGALALTGAAAAARKLHTTVR